MIDTAQAAADRILLTRMARRDGDALASLYDAHARSVYALAVRIVGEPGDAEDVVQAVFAQAWEQSSRYDASRATVAGWLMMMARARAIDRLRARKARPDTGARVEMPEPASDEPMPDAMLVTAEASARVLTALRGLSDPLRVPLELAYYEGLSQSTIAARLGQPLGTVKTRMRTALATLRHALRSEDME